MNLDRSPFVVIPGESPETVGIDMVAAFAAMSTLPDRTGRVFDALMELLGVEPADPVAMAGVRLAADIDSGGGGGHPHPYHNTRHFGEVMLCAYFIAQLQQLPVHATAEVVLAALMHDYGHDGKPNGAVPFRLERQSVVLAGVVTAEVGLTSEQKERLAALVLATDVARGHPAVIAWHVAHVSRPEEAELPPVPSEAPELALLASEALAARQALILCEADVLPSVGLTFGHALKMQAELSAEWETELDVQDKLRFIDEWLKRSTMSLFFKPNVDLLRRSLLSMVLQGSSVPRQQQQRAQCTQKFRKRAARHG